MPAKEVFVSYAEEDKLAADAVVGRLEQVGVTCWIAPRDVLPGADWVASIMKGIGAARIMVLVYSEHANRSGYIQREVGRAVEKKTYIIPLRLDQTAPTEELEFLISTLQWMDAFPPPLDPHLDRLLQSVELVLANSAPTETTRASNKSPQSGLPPSPPEVSPPPPPRTVALPQVILGPPTYVHQVPMSSTQGPTIGMQISLMANVLNARGRTLQLAAKFSYAHGPPLYANVQEPLYRDTGGLVATGTALCVLASEDDSLGVQTMSIPYYALNFMPTNGVAAYNLSFVVFAYLDNQLVAQTPPAVFGFRW